MKNQTLDERLRQYETAGQGIGYGSKGMLYALSAVSGAGLLLGAVPAEAAIQYSGLQNQNVNATQNSFKVNFDGAGDPDFTFRLFSSSSQLLSAFQGTAPAGQVIKNNGQPANLISNYAVSSQRVFAAVSSEELALGNSSVYDPGNFLNQQGYLGVTFQLNGNTHYGWIQYKANVDATVGTVIDWAYEDIPGAVIKTGDTGKKKFNWNLFLPAIINGKKI